MTDKEVAPEPLLPPEITKVGNSFHLTYPNLPIRLRFCRLYDQKNGLTAEVIVEGKDNEDKPIIYDSSRYTLTALASRNNLAKHLANRLELVDVDWEGVVLQAFTKVVNTYRLGEPLVELKPTDILKPLDYLIHPLLPTNMPTTLYGDGGVGKSTVAVFICTLLVSAYAEAHELGLKIPKEPVRCLYLDWEADRDEISNIFLRIKNGLGIDDENVRFHYRRCWQPLSEDMDEIQRVVAEIKPSLVVIDSIAAAVQSDMADAGTATKLISRDIRQLNCTSLILAHYNKTKEQEKSIFGSIFWKNYSRAVFELIKGKESVKDRMQVGIFCRKFNRSFIVKPIGLEFSYVDNDAIYIHKHSVGDSPSLSSNIAIHERIKAVLTRKPATTQELASTFKLKEETIKKILSEHSDMFLLKIDGKWGVISNMPSEVYR